MVLPPPLTWVSECVSSISRAVGRPILYDLKTSVNPLIFELKLSWDEPLGGKLAMGVWNLLQKWAAFNGASTQGEVEAGTRFMIIHVAIPRRFGPERNVHPWEQGLRRRKD